jgi:isopenicillin N synthase-like dioxygenase
MLPSRLQHQQDINSLNKMKSLLLKNNNNDDDDDDDDNDDDGNTRGSSKQTIPLIELPLQLGDDDDDDDDDDKISHRVVEALQRSGFLLLQSPHLPPTLQKHVIQATNNIFGRSTLSNIVKHPTDPKEYLMINCHSQTSLRQDLTPPPTTTTESSSSSEDHNDDNDDNDDDIDILLRYVQTLEIIKNQLMELIAIGLGLPSPQYLVSFHQHQNNVLRLLHYFPTTIPTTTTTSDDDGKESTTTTTTTTTAATPVDDDDEPPPPIIVRCKAHSDYGSLTLLLVDGVPGLQAYVDNEWMDVPYVEGALVVNVGSLLSEWTDHQLLATLHRVVVHAENTDTPSSSSSSSSSSRTSLAYFVDPDPEISTKLLETGEDEKRNHRDNEDDNSGRAEKMTVAEYIQWRSGGCKSNVTREGVQFTENEQQRLR